MTDYIGDNENDDLNLSEQVSETVELVQKCPAMPKVKSAPTISIEVRRALQTRLGGNLESRATSLETESQDDIQQRIKELDKSKVGVYESNESTDADFAERKRQEEQQALLQSIQILDAVDNMGSSDKNEAEQQQAQQADALKHILCSLKRSAENRKRNREKKAEQSLYRVRETVEGQQAEKDADVLANDIDVSNDNYATELSNQTPQTNHTASQHSQHEEMTEGKPTVHLSLTAGMVEASNVEIAKTDNHVNERDQPAATSDLSPTVKTRKQKKTSRKKTKLGFELPFFPLQRGNNTLQVLRDQDDSDC